MSFSDKCFYLLRQLTGTLRREGRERREEERRGREEGREGRRRGRERTKGKRERREGRDGLAVESTDRWVLSENPGSIPSIHVVPYDHI